MSIIFLLIALTSSRFLNDFACSHINEKNISFIDIFNALRENEIYYILITPSTISVSGSYLTYEDLEREIKKEIGNLEDTIYGLCVLGNKGLGITIQITRSVELQSIKRDKDGGEILLKPLNKDVKTLKIVSETDEEKCESKEIEGKESLKLFIPSNVRKLEIIPVRDVQELPEIIIPLRRENIQIPPARFGSPIKRLFELINEERRRRGLKELELSKKLSEVAEFHSKEMVDYNFFAHNSPYSGSPADRAKRFNISFTKITENIGMGETPEEIHALLMDSPIHKCNILDPEVSIVGIGIAIDKNNFLIITENFASPR